ncbi:unnamed protein product [Camellia sinensis]
MELSIKSSSLEDSVSEGVPSQSLSHKLCPLYLKFKSNFYFSSDLLLYLIFVFGLIDIRI